MKVIKKIKDLQLEVKKYVNNRKAIGFIPTMGALHIGHLSLIQKARKENDTVIVSIFINPKQFNNSEDLKRYPRTVERDIELIKDFVDIIFLPKTDEIYPDGFNTTVHITDLAEIGEGAFRPGHFDGMATVVLKLLNATQPTKAYFGKKDYQQFLIVRQMAKDLNLSTQIIGGETVREESGLAMSSRNMRLAISEKDNAAIIFRALQKGKESIHAGERNSSVICRIITQVILTVEGINMEYVEIRNKINFNEVQVISDDVVILIAVTVGDVRLIDNMEVSL